MNRISSSLILFILCSALITTAQGQPPATKDLPRLPDYVESMRVFSGFFRFYWDDATGRLLLEVPRDRAEFLAINSLRTGLGSNPIGLDRGQFGDTKVVRFRRVGRKLLLIQHNLQHRALTDNQSEVRAVRESFPDSVVWAAPVLAETEAASLVDLTSYLLRDAHGATAAIRGAGQGEFRLDAERSVIELDHTFAFPDNVDFDALLTFASTDPGRLVRGVAADAEAVTLFQHHSFVRLPDGGYLPRRYDPRVGAFSISYANYAAAIDEPLERRWITRHRLRKQYPELDLSPPIEPIVYYLDPGAPQPVQDALLVGARWWNEAFVAAGFRNAFEVRLLPEDAHPLDVRYNVIQWVHRATRGWSYGQSVVDPRTGEILKGHVLLGSQRVRQDRRIMEGLVGGVQASATPAIGRGNARRRLATPNACAGDFALPEERFLALLDPTLSPTAVALSRIRQLSAHEVGHTLGFAHNFAASTYGDRASVMDYPAPRITIGEDGSLSAADAYGVGVGAWDKFAVRYAYSQFQEEQDEQQQLNQLVAEGLEQGLIYLSDQDARPAGAAEPLANLWDNGDDVAAELDHVLRVRRLALERFASTAVQEGDSLGDLELDFVPIYLHHRYQVQATLKAVGGFHYRYALAGDGQPGVQAVELEQQRAALEALLRAIEPAALDIPDEILALLAPAADSGFADVEHFNGRTGRIFDWQAAAESAVTLVVQGILHPQRAARLQRDPRENWRLAIVLRELRLATFAQPELTGRQAVLQQLVQTTVVDELIQLAADVGAASDARATVEAELRLLLSESLRGADNAHALRLRTSVLRFLDRPYPTAQPPKSLAAPPGSPIGR